MVSSRSCHRVQNPLCPPAPLHCSLVPLPLARCACPLYCMPTEHSSPLHSISIGLHDRRRITLLTLPHELLNKIAAHVVALPGLFPGSAFISPKPHWGTIVGLATASRAMRDVALRAWFHTMVLNDEEDWDVVAGFADVRFFVRLVPYSAILPVT